MLQQTRASQNERWKNDDINFKRNRISRVVENRDVKVKGRTEMKKKKKTPAKVNTGRHTIIQPHINYLENCVAFAYFPRKRK